MKELIPDWTRRLIPRGSPLWRPYSYGRRVWMRLRGAGEVANQPEYVIHHTILLPPQKAIYFFIPKVACSSVKFVLAQTLNLGMQGGDVVEEVHKIHFPTVPKYQVLTKYKDYFRFCFVRNPWDRLVSCYKDKINYTPGHVYERYNNPFVKYLTESGFFKPDMSFEDFVGVVCQIPDSHAEGHFRSQHLFVEDEQGRLLVDFIGKFETMDRDFAAVKRRIDLKGTVPHLRKTGHKPYWEFYNERTIEMVAQRYQRDIQLFNFQFRPPETA